MKFANLNLANLPVINLDNFDCSEQEFDPEILLTDSEDEDDFTANYQEDDAETAIDSADQDCLSDGSMSDMDVFDEEPIKNDARILFQAAE